MKPAKVSRAVQLATCAALLGAEAVVIARGLRPAGPMLPQQPVLAALPSRMLRLDSLADVVIDANPFRLDRSPADVAFGEPDLASAPPPPQPQRPQPPIVTALLGGTAWRAVLENVPGSEHALLVESGMRAGPFTVIAISASGVRLSSGDTTWFLRLRGQ